MNSYRKFFNPEIPGLRVLNPGISGLAKLAGIPGFGIPSHNMPTRPRPF